MAARAYVLAASLAGAVPRNHGREATWASQTSCDDIHASKLERTRIETHRVCTQTIGSIRSKLIRETGGGQAGPASLRLKLATQTWRHMIVVA